MPRKPKDGDDGKLRLTLSFVERIEFGCLLPSRADTGTLVIARDIARRVGLTAAEVKAAGYVTRITADGKRQSGWDNSKAPALKVALDSVEVTVLKTQIAIMDQLAKKDQKLGPPAALLDVCLAVKGFVAPADAT